MNGRAAFAVCLEQRSSARLRLYCLPYAGGGSAAFRGWAAHASRGVELWLAQLPGRDLRIDEPAQTRIEPLVDALVAELRESPVPFALFGHSMGALLAFEAGRALERMGGPAPARVVVSGRRAPHLAPNVAPMHALPEADFVERLRALKGTPEEVLSNPDLMSLMLPILRADFSVCESYAFTEGPPLRCGLTAFAGMADTLAGLGDVAQWRQHASSFKLRAFPGGHFFLHSSRAAVLAALREELLPALDAAPGLGLGPARLPA